MSSLKLFHKRRLWVFSALFFSVFVQAVDQPNDRTASLKINGELKHHLGREACGSSEEVEIVLPQKATQDYDNFRITRAPEGKKNDPKDTKCPNKITEKTDMVNISETSPKFKQSDFPLLLPKSKACPEDKNGGSSGYAKLCIYSGTSGEGHLVGEVPYSYDTRGIEFDNITNESAFNGTIQFTANTKNTSKSIKNVIVCFGEANLQPPINNEGCPGTWTERSFPDPKVKLTDLKDDTKYLVVVRLEDENGNKSPWSRQYEFTPAFAYMPLNAYNGAGGQLMWSCQNTQSSWYYLLPLFLFLLLLRIKKPKVNHTPLLLLALLIIAIPKEANAHVGQVSIGLLGSMYRPDLDSEMIQSRSVFPIYKCFFRKHPDALAGPIRPLLGAEFDVNLWDGFGSLQLGLGLGYSWVHGHGLGRNDSGEPDCNNSIMEAPISLHMYQLRPQLTYVFDPFADVFPFVPYIRGALIAHGYSFRSGGEKAPNAEHGDILLKPNGFRFGWQAAAGLMLRLDFLEPGAVRSAHGSGFFEHVALKAELSYTKITSFGRPGFNFSPKDVMGSRLPLMWTFGLVFNLP